MNERKCPHCGSGEWEPVHPFDYIKVCKKCGKQFSASPHN